MKKSGVRVSYLSDHGFSGIIDAHDGEYQLLMVLNDTKMQRHVSGFWKLGSTMLDYMIATLVNI